MIPFLEIEFLPIKMVISMLGCGESFFLSRLMSKVKYYKQEGDYPGKNNWM